MKALALLIPLFLLIHIKGIEGICRNNQITLDTHHASILGHIINGQPHCRQLLADGYCYGQFQTAILKGCPKTLKHVKQELGSSTSVLRPSMFEFCSAVNEFMVDKTPNGEYIFIDDVSILVQYDLGKLQKQLDDFSSIGNTLLSLAELLPETVVVGNIVDQVAPVDYNMRPMIESMVKLMASFNTLYTDPEIKLDYAGLMAPLLKGLTKEGGRNAILTDTLRDAGLALLTRLNSLVNRIEADIIKKAGNGPIMARSVVPAIIQVTKSFVCSTLHFRYACNLVELLRFAFALKDSGNIIGFARKIGYVYDNELPCRHTMRPDRYLALDCLDGISSNNNEQNTLQPIITELLEANDFLLDCEAAVEYIGCLPAPHFLNYLVACAGQWSFDCDDALNTNVDNFSHYINMRNGLETYKTMEACSPSSPSIGKPRMVPISFMRNSVYVTKYKTEAFYNPPGFQKSYGIPKYPPYTEYNTTSPMYKYVNTEAYPNEPLPKVTVSTADELQSTTAITETEAVPDTTTTMTTESSTTTSEVEPTGDELIKVNPDTVDTTTSDVTTPTVPLETPAVLLETTTVPLETRANLLDTTTVPLKTTTVPLETTTEKIEITNDQSSSTTEPESTHPKLETTITPLVLTVTEGFDSTETTTLLTTDEVESKYLTEDPISDDEDLLIAVFTTAEKTSETLSSFSIATESSQSKSKLVEDETTAHISSGYMYNRSPKLFFLGLLVLVIKDFF